MDRYGCLPGHGQHPYLAWDRVHHDKTMKLIDLLFPKICQNCGESFGEGLSNILCRPCLDFVSPYEDPVCDHCGISLPVRGFEDTIFFRCRYCREESYYLDKVRAVGPYEGPLRIAHHGFKFEGMQKLRFELAKKMAESAIPAFWEGVEALVPVPLSSERERERGYNPARLLADEISKTIHVPVHTMLKKVMTNKPQMSLTREERLRNPKGAYRITLSKFIPKKVILVDDVFTTGATLEECAKMLKNTGVIWVGAIVLGRTPRN